MFDSIIIIFFVNLFILTLIFWIVSICGEKFLKKKYNISNNEVFECGFLNINKLRILPNTYYFIFIILLIIYDIEFFLFIPLFFNINYINMYYIIIILTLFVLLLISFIFDWQHISVNWFF